MKKASCVIIFFVFIAVSSFSDERFDLRTSGLYTHYSNSYLRFTEDGRITRYTRDRETNTSQGPFGPFKVEEGNYNISLEDGITYINVNWDFDWEIDSPDRWLLLFYGGDGRILLYDNDSEPFFIGTHVGSIFWSYDAEWSFGGGSFEQPKITASSSLREGNILHSPDNLNISIGRPWVEGVAGHGIGETLVLLENWRLSQGQLYISIGFVSYDRPHLYSFNSRPSRIRISSGTNSRIVNLIDTPHFQRIEIGSFSQGNIEIEILDVYPGTRWQDTSIVN